MRTLHFLVDGQVLSPDPNCDFYSLVPSSNRYIRAEFTFSKEWENTPKVVGFYSRLGREYTPKVLKDGRTCIIPDEALKKRFFKLKVMGHGGLATNKLLVEQKGGDV